MNYFASTAFLYMSFPDGEKKKEGSQIRGLHMYSALFFSSQQPLTPEVVVQLVPKYVEQGHDWHVEKEEGHKTSRAEVPKKGIHPNSNWQVHPDNPTEQKERRCHRVWQIILCCLVWRKGQVQIFMGLSLSQKKNTLMHATLDVFMNWTMADLYKG